MYFSVACECQAAIGVSLMKIDPRHLALLVSIAKHGSFNRAAAICGISQPALSNSIAQLESSLGAPVLYRSRRGSTLTDTGNILLKAAENVSAILTQAAEELSMMRSGGLAGALRIGVTPSVSLRHISKVSAKLLKQYPATELVVIEGSDDHLLSSLQLGQLDLVVGQVTGASTAPANIVEDLLFDDTFSVGMRRRHPLSNIESLTLGQLRDASWVLPPVDSSYGPQIEALFSSAGVPWPINCLTTSNVTLVESIIAQTDCVTILTNLTVMFPSQRRLKSVALKGGGSHRLSIKWRRNAKLSANASQFIKLAHEAVSLARQRRAVAKA